MNISQSDITKWQLLISELYNIYNDGMSYRVIYCHCIAFKKSCLNKTLTSWRLKHLHSCNIPVIYNVSHNQDMSCFMESFIFCYLFLSIRIFVNCRLYTQSIGCALIDIFFFDIWFVCSNCGYLQIFTLCC